MQEKGSEAGDRCRGGVWPNSERAMISAETSVGKWGQRVGGRTHISGPCRCGGEMTEWEESKITSKFLP